METRTTPPKSTAERVKQRRNNLREAGLRPVQIWVSNTSAPGFAEEAARQCRLLAAWEASPAGRALAQEAWDTPD